MMKKTILVGGGLTALGVGSGYLFRDSIPAEMFLPFCIGWALLIALSLGVIAALTNDEFRKRGFIKRAMISGSYLVGLGRH